MEHVFEPCGGLAILKKLNKQKINILDHEKNESVIAYGSETGNCEEIAKNIHAEAVKKGFRSRLSCLDHVVIESSSSSSFPSSSPIFLIIVTSSTGDGDPPSNATNFWKRTRSVRDLHDLHFTILGLGDSNYTRYQNVSRTIQKRLTDAGAKLFYRSAEADEVDGIEDVVDTWIDGLWCEMKNKSKENEER